MNQAPKVPSRSWKSIDTIASEIRKILFTDTLAHEIGHKVLHDSYFIEAISEKRCIPILHRQQIPAYQDPECQANQFASAFLMPIEMVIFDIKNNLSVSEIANKYHVSFDAAYFRTQYVKKKYAIIPDETPGIAAEKTVRR